MIKRLFILTTLGVMLSGCFMAPMALIGPAASGFSSASLIQSGASTGASYLIKRTTGKTVTEHALDVLSDDILKQTYFPTEKNKKLKVKK